MRRVLWLSLLVALAPLAGAGEISPAGQKLLTVLNSLEVEKHWLAGTRVDWETGEPTSAPLTTPGAHSHCSAFAAAACARLGIYLLRPPEHSPQFLANAQYDWLAGPGFARGWRAVDGETAAQNLANAGSVVLAVCQEPSGTPGHIALVLPSAEPGVAIMQAGQNNYQSTTLAIGFHHHPGALAGHGIRFYAHEQPAATAPAAPRSSP